MRLRRMNLHDLPEILRLEKILFDDAWSRQSFETEISKNKYSIPLVLEDGDQIVGYAILWKIFEEFHIANIAIRPEYQGRKLGEYLLSESLKLAENCNAVFLEVCEDNLKAISLYQKFGFEIMFRRKFYYKNGETALVMRKKPDNIRARTE